MEVQYFILLNIVSQNNVSHCLLISIFLCLNDLNRKIFKTKKKNFVYF